MRLLPRFFCICPQIGLETAEAEGYEFVGRSVGTLIGHDANNASVGHLLRVAEPGIVGSEDSGIIGFAYPGTVLGIEYHPAHVAVKYEIAIGCFRGKGYGAESAAVFVGRNTLPR